MVFFSACYDLVEEFTNLGPLTSFDSPNFGSFKQLVAIEITTASDVSASVSVRVSSTDGTVRDITTNTSNLGDSNEVNLNILKLESTLQ